MEGVRDGAIQFDAPPHIDTTIDTWNAIHIPWPHGGVALDYGDMAALDQWATLWQGGIVMLGTIFAVATVILWGVALVVLWRNGTAWVKLQRAYFIRDLAKEIAGEVSGQRAKF